MSEHDKSKHPGRRYVITRDIDSAILWEPWLSGKVGRQLPEAGVFKQMRRALHEALDKSLALDRAREGADYEIEYWGKGGNFKFHRFRHHRSEFICSLDPVVVPDHDHVITTTRVWNEDGNKIARPKTGTKSIKKQVEDALCKEKLDQMRKKSVVLADDGIFEGGTMTEVAAAFQARDVEISAIRAGIAQAEDTEKLRLKLTSLYPNISFSPQFTVGQAGLKEWLCERDFFVGLPRSGRTHRFEKDTDLTDSIQTGIPYLHGWPGSSAARLSHGRFEFGARLTSISIEFWGVMSKLNGKLLVRDLPRFPGPRVQPSPEVLEMGVVEYLELIERLVYGPENKKARKRQPVLL